MDVGRSHNKNVLEKIICYGSATVYYTALDPPSFCSGNYVQLLVVGKLVFRYFRVIIEKMNNVPGTVCSTSIILCN